MTLNKMSLGFNQASPWTRFDPPADDGLQALLRSISSDGEALSAKIRSAVRLLIRRREWTAAIRLVVGVAGHQQADVARELGVMRSTVARWYNGETRPSDEQMEEFGRRLQEMLAAVPELELAPQEPLVS